MKTITAIERQKNHKNRYNLFINNSFYMGVDENIIIKYSLSPGMEVSEEFMENIVKAEEYSKAFNSALNQLSYRARSKSEVEKNLRTKGYSCDAIKNAIEKLEKFKYLDDVAFANSYIKEKQNINKVGKRMLKQGLYQKGIDKELIDQIVTENVKDEEEYLRALELAQKKNSNMNSEKNKNKKYKKLSDILSRKGYSFDIISKVLKIVLNDSLEII